MTLSGTVSDARFNNSNGTEATQTIAAAEYYIDVPHWSPGAATVALTASDGTFSSVTENITGTINQHHGPKRRQTHRLRAQQGSERRLGLGVSGLSGNQVNDDFGAASGARRRDNWQSAISSNYCESLLNRRQRDEWNLPLGARKSLFFCLFSTRASATSRA